MILIFCYDLVVVNNINRPLICSYYHFVIYSFSDNQSFFFLILFAATSVNKIGVVCVMAIKKIPEP